jgi:hypothetical protein
MASIIRSLLIIAIVAAGLYLIWPTPRNSKSGASAIPEAAALEQNGKPNEVAARARALDRLEKASQKSWVPVTDMNTRRLKTLKGGALALESTTPKEKSDEFIREYASDLFGVDPKNLSYDRVIKTDRIKVVYHQIIGGVRVFMGNLALVYDDGLLMRVQSDLSGLPIEPEAPVLTVAEAEKRVQTYGAQISNGGGAQVTLVTSEPNLKTELFYYPAAKNLVLAYQMIVDVWKDAKHSKRMEVFVNAHDGTFIQSHYLHVD